MSSTTDMYGNDNAIPVEDYSSKTCVAWGAIIAGALVAAAVSLILLVLGSALGLSAVSPFSTGESIASFTVKVAIWLIVMQWISAGLGGYLTGRLRSKWDSMHTDEVFFRDTAHGFLTWAVATLLTASVLASATAAVVGGGMHAATTLAAGEAARPPAPPAGPHPDPMNGYYIDSLFRSATPAPNGDTKDARMEATQILMMGVKNGNVPDDDKAYLAQQVSARTGVNNAEAMKRVNDTIANLNAAKDKAKQDAEEARKTARNASMYTFISLLIGAFIASTAAALGGRHRDVY